MIKAISNFHDIASFNNREKKLWGVSVSVNDTAEFDFTVSMIPWSQHDFTLNLEVVEKYPKKPCASSSKLFKWPTIMKK